MKKILLLIVVLMSFNLFSQSDELMKMYQRITGKDLTKEIEKLKGGKTPTQIQTEPSLLDTVMQKSDIPENLRIEPDEIWIKTYFEKYVNDELIDPYKSELKQYRIDFSAVRTNLNYNKQIPDNYIINSGDIFVIDIWGAMEKNYNLEVTNESFIIVPQIGKIDISGMNYKDAKISIESKLSNINGIRYSVRLGEVKPITVFVVGNISKPGVYNVSPFSSILEVLALAGGVNPEGSLRSIGLISEKSGSKFIDLYSLLFFGKNPVSILESNMTI
ncbi:MAG: SLBB domain-containing protein, partial [Candidatus Delongbacteria bacterium]|nr:SLBB domain-containing protein [Candidatus Delongbacteria bacterium]